MRNGCGFRLRYQTGFFMDNMGSETSHIAYDHGFFKMIGEGCNTTLRGVPVRLYNSVCCAEIALHLTVWYEIGFKDEQILYMQQRDQIPVYFLVLIIFTGNQQTDTCFPDTRFGHGPE